MCALAEIANGKFKRKALLKWGIFKSTLRNCKIITLLYHEAASHLQRLPTVIKNQLTN